MANSMAFPPQSTPAPPCPDPGRKVELMGILNITPDSFWEGSRTLDGRGLPLPEALLSMAGAHLEGGAAILDIGACSTRPGSRPVGEEEEWLRLGGALAAIREAFPKARISVDTFRSGIVERCHDIVGEVMVNDISAGGMDPAMLATVGRLGLPYVAMHMRGTPETMQGLADYGMYAREAGEAGMAPVTCAAIHYFREFSRAAEEAGIRSWTLDPGFGFAKTIEQNYALLKELPRLRAAFPERPVLCGLSRKSMAYRVTGTGPEEALCATQVLNFCALQGGADILRVHDCAEAARTIALYRKFSGL